jgi:toxin CcdB
MAQFDVHLNTGKQKDAIPYVVIVQSSLFDSYRRRVVIPLVRRSNLVTSSVFADMPLNPVFIIDDVEVILHPLEIVSISSEQLGDKVTSLEEEGDRITAALDELLTRAWA